jgi:GAF domain-containing protein
MAMHQTTVRFGSDLWEQLQTAADRQGVSVAQFLRESAIIRLASERAPARVPAVPGSAKSVREDAHAVNKESSAVWAQARQARARAVSLRGDSRQARASRWGAPGPPARGEARANPGRAGRT